MGRMDGKVAIVTGAAQGNGLGIAELFAAEGAKVVLTDIKEEKGACAADRISEKGHVALFVEHDVTREDAWNRVIDRTLDVYGQLDVLVNNAGVSITATTGETDLEGWRWVHAVNLDGMFLGTKLAAVPMQERGGGSIVNISSMWASVGVPGYAAYCASKGGATNFTKAAALDYAPFNIRVNAIHPGFIATPMTWGELEELDDPEKGLAELVAMHPIGRIGEPEDVAYGALYLASDESSFVTGSELVIDGGYLAQ